MHYLKDFCALIFSGVTLYDGLTSNRGVVAVYGKGDLVHTLYKPGSDYNIGDTFSILKSHPRIKPVTLEYKEDKIFSTTCVSKDDGIVGLEEFLFERGFRVKEFKHQSRAAELYFLHSNEHSRDKMEYEITLAGNSLYGRKIASAVSMSQIRLTGEFRCASSKDNQATKEHYMDSPLDMGFLKVIHISKYLELPRALVFLNGQLRILIGGKEKNIDFHNMIWDIYPKLDRTEDYGLMKRKILDDYLHYDSYRVSSIFDGNKGRRILLGCQAW